jgi:clan AA aspartic protease (TIGR02281 family)
MAEGLLPASGPIVVYVELVGPRTSRTITMALDTGATLTIVPIETALAIGYDPAAVRKRIELITASGTELAPRLTIQTARCLGRTVKNLDVACHDLPTQSPVKGLLGLSFLRHFNVHLDFLSKRLELRTTA